MKKIFAALLTICLCVGLCACGTKSENSNSSQNSSTPSASITDKDSNKTPTSSQNLPKPGSSMTFGSYEQDSNTGNGKEPIEWIILDVEGTRALILSKYVLDVHKYHPESTDMTWENCELRAWLNNAFFNTAFTAEEQKKIPLVTVSADANQTVNIAAGNDTQDRVFVLSGLEADRYFASDSERQCKATAYAVAQGAFLTEDYCFWWLRTPGKKQTMASCVTYDGDVGYGGQSVISTYPSVRPAIWIDLSA